MGNFRKQSKIKGIIENFIEKNVLWEQTCKGGNICNVNVLNLYSWSVIKPVELMWSDNIL